MSHEALKTYEGATPGQQICEGHITVTQADIDEFCRLLGYDHPAYRADAPGGAIAPPSMGLTYGLRLGWEADVFPPGVIRMGDENVHGHSVRAGDELTTALSIVDKFERKGRKFLKYEFVTTNQSGQLVCSVKFAAIVA
ncbi:MAG: MaoC family dehydratase [Rhizobiaceae bacterium]|nr:MaoC family dehydratase [Rhizobiaceae bacterium]